MTIIFLNRLRSCGRLHAVYFSLMSLFITGSMILVEAKVLRVDIQKRTPVLDQRAFGSFGSYEIIEGTIHFAFDPAHPMNHRIVDLDLAPRNESGLVEAWANFVTLQPSDVSRARGVALVEVSNRGGKFSPRYYNRAAGSALDPGNPEDFGDGLLMKQGLTVIWVGWQPDVPEREGLLRLHVPVAKNPDGSTITGLVRSDWTVDAPSFSLPLGHRNHTPYPVVDPGDAADVLTVRDGRDAPRRVVPRQLWRFAREEEGRIINDPGHVYLETGFQAGKIYELVYTAQDPLVIGLGPAAIRDVISYAKYDETCPFPVKYGVAAGVSQTGRFLRLFLYQGFNTDEESRQAYDGLMIITAGAGRGSFNHRFAQPSRDAHRYSAFFYPTDIFPFTSRSLQDTQQWRTDGLLSHMDLRHMPKVFYINTGYEYWGRAASLIHTSPCGSRDVEPVESERIYHLASGQHFVGRFPPRDDDKVAETPVFQGNPLDFSVNYRALLVRLVEWAAEGVTPPASAYPRKDEGTLVPIDQVVFPKIPAVTFPEVIHYAYRADYGPRWLSRGIVDIQPPILGGPFLSQVCQVDRFGNEMTGVRNVETRVPLATYTPWNLRTGFPGGENELTDFLGTFIPLPLTAAKRTAAGDPRPSIEQLYPSRDEYLDRVNTAAEQLVDEGFLLKVDIAYVVEKAGTYWDWIHQE